jgi:hypothetical protein
MPLGWLQRQQLGSATAEFVRHRIDGAKLLELALTPDRPLLAVFNSIQKKKVFLFPLSYLSYYLCPHTTIYVSSHHCIWELGGGGGRSRKGKR